MKKYCILSMPSLLYVFNKKKSNAQCSATESCVLLELERAAVICFTFGRWHSQLDGLENCFQKVRKISSGGLLNIQHSPLQQIAEYLAIHDTMTSVQPGGWWQVMSYSEQLFPLRSQVSLQSCHYKIHIFGAFLEIDKLSKDVPLT